MTEWEKVLKQALLNQAVKNVDPDGSHPDDLLLLDFLDHDLNKEIVEETLCHLANCPRCVKRTDQLETLKKQPVKPTPVPVTTAKILNFRVLTPLALAAALVLVLLWRIQPSQPVISISPMRYQLFSTATRNEGELRLLAHKDALDLQLHLEPTQNYPTYRVVFTQNGLSQTFDTQQEGGTVSIIMPKTRLHPGPLLIQLYGLDEAPTLLVEHQLSLEIL